MNNVKSDRNIETLTNELYEALRISYLDSIKKEGGDDSSETSTATYESISRKVDVIHMMLERYIDGETCGQFLGGPDCRQVELSDLILKNDNLLAERADQSLFSMVDSIAYLSSQFAMALYDDWEENFDDGEWRIKAMQAMRADKDFTTPSSDKKRPWD